jgi:hypothetical protein
VAELEKSGEDLKARLSCVKAAYDTLKTLVTLEAEAWGFANIQDDKPVEVVVDEMEGARRLAFALTKAAKLIENQPTIH